MLIQAVVEHILLLETTWENFLPKLLELPSSPITY